uniref:XV conotoxin Ca15a n=1 Tax=Conus caracteristicus TaxID=89440 RepID=C8CK80_CONCB|nr:XV conotoxin Ca15a precursor [Conus caracteristicus]
MEKLTILILVATVLLAIQVLVQSDREKPLKGRVKQYAAKRLSALLRGPRECTPMHRACEEDEECCPNLECKCSSNPDCQSGYKCRP